MAAETERFLPRPRRWSRRWRPSGVRFDAKVLPWLLMAPAGLVLAGFVAFPVARTFWLSFQDAGLPFLFRGESEFVGLRNYAELFSDGHLREVFFTTVWFGLACVAGTMALGMAVAVLLDQRFRGRALLGVVVLLPWAIPRVAAGTVWRWMFHDQYGLVNWALPGFDGHAWFNDRFWAFLAIGIVVVWQSFPFVALTLLAGLRSIPPEVREAARVDGASPAQQLWHVTLPMLKPLITTLVVISTIWDFKIFDQIYVMTEGGPNRSTEVAAITVYREAFARSHLGSASALAIGLFVVLVAMTVLYTRATRADEPLTAG